jgi:hypothetical protein
MNTLLIILGSCLIGSMALEIKGVNFVSHPLSRIQYSDQRARLALEHLATLGANTISIPITFFQDFKNSSLAYQAVHPFILESGINETPLEKDVLSIVQEAKSLGLKVMLQFQAHINRPFWEPTSTIGDYWAPYNARIWFPRYTELIVQYLRALDSAEVDFVSVGHDMYTVSLFEHLWKELADSLRNETKAKITYSAAFGDEDRNSGFWESYDYVGVFPRFQASTPDQLALETKEFARTLLYMNKLWKKPVLVTRVATCSRTQDRISQSQLFAAVHEAVKDLPFVHGLFFGDWVSDILYGSASDVTYSFQQKPAEETARQLFGGQKREIGKPEGEVDYRLNCDCYKKETQKQ